MSTQLEWEHVGPPREHTIELPGLSIGNSAYVLVYDPDRDRIVYIRTVNYNVDSGLSTWDGEKWTLSTTKTQLASEIHAFHDPTRRGIAVWSAPYDHELERQVPRGTMLDGEPIATTGE